MSLKAQVTTTGDVTVMEVAGKLNHESQKMLQDNIEQLMRDGKQVVLDIEGLDFVGSSGITSFFRNLKETGERTGVRPRFCNVSLEFKRIMDAYNLNGEMIHESRIDAVRSFFRSGSGENN